MATKVISAKLTDSLEHTTGHNMETTLVGQKRHSGMQEMGETREPMAFDCWNDAQTLAEKYADKLNRDFWVLFAAKPHASISNGIVAGWEVIGARPPSAMVGVLVFKWVHAEKRLIVEQDLSLPYDVPLSELELSTSSKDVVPTIARAAQKSGSIFLA